MIHVRLTPSRNEMLYTHHGCDSPGDRYTWMVPLDDCPAPAVGDMRECAECAQMVRISIVYLTEDTDWGQETFIPAHKPHRGSNVEAFIKRARDQVREELGKIDPLNSAHDFAHGRLAAQEQALDRLLDDYRLHADTGVPLDQHVSDGGYSNDPGART